MDGATDGATDEVMDGATEGAIDGTSDKATEGATDGDTDEVREGAIDRTTDRTIEKVERVAPKCQMKARTQKMCEADAKMPRMMDVMN